MKNKKNVKYIILIVVLFIGFIIFNFIKKDDFLVSYKENPNKEIVYSIYNKKNTSIPNINIKNDFISNINKSIVDKSNVVLNDDRNNVTYFYNLSGKVLSLVVQYLEYNDFGNPNISFDTYNINIEKNIIYQPNDLLSIFQITEEDVDSLVQSKFAEFYADEISKGVFDDECSYDCFLNMRGIKDEDYMNNVSYYVNNGNLYVLRPFNYYDSAFNREIDYFSFNDYIIQITE